MCVTHNDIDEYLVMCLAFLFSLVLVLWFREPALAQMNNATWSYWLFASPFAFYGWVRSVVMRGGDAFASTVMHGVLWPVVAGTLLLLWPLMTVMVAYTLMLRGPSRNWCDG